MYKRQGILSTSYDLDLSPEESPDGILLISESDKSIPKNNLMFLGNLPGNDLIPFRGHDYWLNYVPDVYKRQVPSVRELHPISRSLWTFTTGGEFHPASKTAIFCINII